MHTYRHARPALTVDCVVFGLDEGDLKVLLVQRNEKPYAGKWRLPGGFVRIDETIDDAARRELSEKTGLSKIFLEQLYTFGALKRDPRERTVSVAYYALVRLQEHRVKSSAKVDGASWFPVSKLPKLAFDHDEIVSVAIERLRGKVRYQPIGFELLPPKFTLSQLQYLYETVLERSLDKRNFRKKILSMELLFELDEYQRDVAHRAPRLYRFDEKKYRDLKKKGFNFEI